MLVDDVCQVSFDARDEPVGAARRTSPSSLKAYC
jgi:hypothetical protein